MDFYKIVQDASTAAWYLPVLLDESFPAEEFSRQRNHRQNQ